MRNWLHDQRIFWRQFRTNFHTTGALMPSGRALGKALCRFVHSGGSPENGPENSTENGAVEAASSGGARRRILEVGPGTGAVTAQLVTLIRPGDSLDLVELNSEFVARLQQRFASEPRFQRVADRSRVLHKPVEGLASEEPYDLIISGLPLNKLSVELVEHLLATFVRLGRHGGTLSFFEYIAVRPARAPVAGGAERQRLKGIGRALGEVLGPNEIQRDWVWPNIPPAWVHHVRIPGKAVEEVRG